MLCLLFIGTISFQIHFLSFICLARVIQILTVKIYALKSMKRKWLKTILIHIWISASCPACIRPPLFSLQTNRLRSIANKGQGSNHVPAWLHTYKQLHLHILHGQRKLRHIRNDSLLLNKITVSSLRGFPE